MALSNQVKNRHDGKSYRIATSNLPPLNFWRTVVFEVGFLGLSKTTPVLAIVSETEQDASAVHPRVAEAVEVLPASIWRMPDELINLTVFERGKPGWAEIVTQMRDRFLSAVSSALVADSFPERISAISALVGAIIEKSAHCADSLRDMMDGEFWRRRSIDCFLEFVFFFAHIANVLIFGPEGLGEEKGRLLLGRLGPQLAEAAFKVSVGFEGESSKGEFEENFYKALNQAEIEYSNCETLLANQEERTAIEIIATGKTRKGRINQLADRVAKVITGNLLDIAVTERTKQLAVDGLNASPPLAEYVRAAGREV